MESVNSMIDQFEREADLPGSTVMGMVYVPKETRQQVLRKLKQWSEPLDEKFSPRALRKAIISMDARQRPRVNNLSRGTEQDREDYQKLCVTFPKEVFIQRREPELLPLIADYRSGKPGGQEALEEHIDTNWKTNPTMLDLDWEPQRQQEAPPGAHPAEFLPVMDTHPATILQDLGDIPESGGVLGSVGKFFDTLAIAVLQFFDKVQIEVIASEMADVLERAHHDLLDYRFQKTDKDPKNLDPTTFPKVYDRIHMSNIPDYVGGPLAAHLYGGPLLRRDRHANLRFNNLLNPPMFEDHAQFQAEYMLMHDNQQIADHFGFVRDVSSPDSVIDARQAALCRSMGLSPFAAENYWIWHRQGADRIPRNRMMSTPALEHWLHSHLLKICVPYPRPLQSDRPVHAPLNLTMFFRLVGHLYELGYPAHKLSHVLASVCKGSIATTARFPRQLVLTPSDADKRHPQRKISLVPWQAEYTTLLSVWRGLLPFGVLAPPKALVPLQDVVHCKLQFQPFDHVKKRMPHFAIVFAQQRNMRFPQLPALIQDDEAGDQSNYAKGVREKYMHIVMGMKYETASSCAYFWLRRDVADELKANPAWTGVICRTDVWQVIMDASAEPSNGMEILESWA